MFSAAAIDGDQEIDGDQDGAEPAGPVGFRLTGVPKGTKSKYPAPLGASGAETHPLGVRENF